MTELLLIELVLNFTCWLLTAFVFQIWTEDGSPWCRVYDEIVHSNDEDPVPQRGDSQRNLWQNNSYIMFSSYSTVKNWVPQLKTGHFSTEDEDHPGRALLVTVLENVDAVHSTILADQKILAREIAETLEISWECVRFIIHDVSDMRNVFAKWVPKCLNVNQKCDCLVASEAILECCRWNTAGFLAQLWQWIKRGYICIIQRQKNNLRSGDRVIHLV